jgi:hypothetical protein
MYRKGVVFITRKSGQRFKVQMYIYIKKKEDIKFFFWAIKRNVTHLRFIQVDVTLSHKELKAY